MTNEKYYWLMALIFWVCFIVQSFISYSKSKHIERLQQRLEQRAEQAK